MNVLPDVWFTAAQQERLAFLMERWRLARDGGEALSSDEQAELEALIDTELEAAIQRSVALFSSPAT